MGNSQCFTQRMETVFPNSLIFGADIDDVILFTEDIIKTYYCDQTNPDIIKEMWNTSDLHENFDIIIEDGLHTFDANKCFFKNSINKLKKGGIYIIEYITSSDTTKFSEQILVWNSMFPYLEFRLIKIPHSNTHDNNILVVKHN